MAMWASGPKKSQAMEDTNDQGEATLGKTAKAIGDLDELIKAVQLSLPRAKPWQRQLHQYLGEIDRRVQITRMTPGSSPAT